MCLPVSVVAVYYDFCRSLKVFKNSRFFKNSRVFFQFFEGLKSPGKEAGSLKVLESVPESP